MTDKENVSRKLIACKSLLLQISLETILKNYHELHLKALKEASKAVQESREVEQLSKQKKSKTITIHEVMKENKEKTKHLDLIDLKRQCPHPSTGFICNLCASNQVPKEIIQNAVNYGKSPRRDNSGLKALREAYKYQSRLCHRAIDKTH